MASSPVSSQAAAQAIPQPVADHFISTLTALVSTGREAVAACTTSDTRQQASVWQKKVQPLLETRLSAAQAAMTQFAAGNHEPLVAAALPLRFLARDTDGCSLDFAGETFAAQFVERRRLVVLAAWRVCQSAGAA
jgi:hypothetical protein